MAVRRSAVGTAGHVDFKEYMVGCYRGLTVLEGVNVTTAAGLLGGHCYAVVFAAAASCR